MKRLYTAFLCLSLCVCALPFAGMAVRPTTVTAENRVLSAFPSLESRDGGPNTAFFSEFDRYFQEHFAFRNELVAADSTIQAELFHVSANDKVICGTDGWLYYASTLPDYLGTGLLSERDLNSLAHNLELTADWARGRGMRCLLAFPPNKNTLYGEHMPYYDPAPEDTPHNLERLQAVLAERGLPYADLLGLFEAEDEILYLRQDSHWNSRGALLAAARMLDVLSVPHEDFTALPVTRALDHEGDLSRMLFTFYGKKGANYHYDLDGRYRVVKTAGQTGDAWIETAGRDGRGTLLMFRDSFGDALLPFFAASFERACFTKEMPYGLETLAEELAPDVVIFEKGERNLADYLDLPPILSAPVREGALSVRPGAAEGISLQMRTLENDPSYFCIRGSLEGVPLADDDEILAEIDGCVRIPYQTRGSGFLLYLKKSELPAAAADVRLLAGRGEDWQALWSGRLTEEAQNE